MNKTISKTVIFTLCLLTIGQQCSGMEAPRSAQPISWQLTALPNKTMQVDLAEIKNNSNQDLILEKSADWGTPQLVAKVPKGQPIIPVNIGGLEFEKYMDQQQASLNIRNENTDQKPLQLTLIYDPISTNLTANLYANRNMTLQRISKSSIDLRNLQYTPKFFVTIAVPSNLEESTVFLSSQPSQEQKVKKASSAESKKAWETEKEKKPNAFKTWAKNWLQDMELRTFGPGKDGSRIPDYMKQNPHSK